MAIDIPNREPDSQTDQVEYWEEQKGGSTHIIGRLKEATHLVVSDSHKPGVVSGNIGAVKQGMARQLAAMYEERFGVQQS